MKEKNHHGITEAPLCCIATWNTGDVNLPKSSNSHEVLGLCNSKFSLAQPPQYKKEYDTSHQTTKLQYITNYK